MCEASIDCVFVDEDNISLSIGVCDNGTCACSVFVGFTGEACDEISPQVISNRSINFIGLILYSFHLLFALWILFKLYSLKFQVHLDQGKYETLKKTRRLLLIILVFLSLSIGGNFIQILLTLRSLYQPNTLELDNLADEDFIAPSPKEFFAILQVLNLSFYVFSVMAICLSWIDLLSKLADFTTNCNRMKEINRVKGVLKYTLIFGAIVLPFLAIVGLRDINAAIASLLTIILIILIFYGRHYLVKIISEFQNELTVRTINLISKFAFQLGSALVAASVMGILLATFEIRTNVAIEINQVDAATLSLVLSFILILNINFSIVLNYVYSVYQRLNNKSTAKSSNASTGLGTSE